MMDSKALETAYLNQLESRSLMPRGFRFAMEALEFFPKERPVNKALPMNLSAIIGDGPCTFALRLTRNKVLGAPILLAKELRSQASIRGVLINNKVSNVGAPGGLEAAKDLCNQAQGIFGLPPNSLLAASTGIIGWSLPTEAMKQALPKLATTLGTIGPVQMAKAIMTTDRFPKLHAKAIGGGSILGIAKGAGMIEPNLATMLVFIMTDVSLSNEVLHRALGRAVELSFNAISVDSDQSTSDMCVLLSSNLAPTVGEEEFTAALIEVCQGLARDIVRNGEGTKHVIRVSVEGFGDKSRDLGKAVVNSPLVKTAIYGDDPNVGRILASIGDHAGNHDLNLDTSLLTVRLWDQVIFEKGSFSLDMEKETTLASLLRSSAQDPSLHGYPEHGKTVDISIEYGDKSGSAVVFGSDLGYEYIRENADYRS